MTLVLNKSVLQPLNDQLFAKKKLKVFVLRDDLIHPFISGNKWRKLKYNIEQFQKEGKEYLVTFGGAFSNHIVATAAAGKLYSIKTIGIIRGEEHDINSNSVLRFAHNCGMELIFVSREEYRKWKLGNGNSKLAKLLNSKTGIDQSEIYLLPEGGSNEFAVKGCKEIIDDIPVDFDYICCDCGTGATFAGIVSGLKNHQQAIGIAVLKGAEFIDDAVKKYNPTIKTFQVIHDYHFGGYAKSATELDEFCKSFSGTKNIPVEPVYTGKLFYGLYDLIRKDFFAEGKTIVVVHTGGVLNIT